MKCPVPKKVKWPTPKPEGEWLTLDSAPLCRGEKWCDSYLVTFPISYEYNGGIVWEDGKWYRGFKVSPPVVPEGYELTNIYVSPQYNSRPPYETMYLEKI